MSTPIAPASDELIKRAVKIAKWLNSIEYCEGSYPTSNGADVIMALLARLSQVEQERDNQYDQAVEATQRALVAEDQLAHWTAKIAQVRALPMQFDAEMGVEGGPALIERDEVLSLLTEETT